MNGARQAFDGLQRFEKLSLCKPFLFWAKNNLKEGKI